MSHKNNIKHLILIKFIKKIKRNLAYRKYNKKKRLNI